MTRILAQVPHFPLLRFGDGAGPGALASAIERATIRHWISSETVARDLCTRPWLEVQPEVRAALLVSITQLLYMPDEPTHAVVDDAVRFVRGRLQQGAGGFVNAILRKASTLRVGRVKAPDAGEWWDARDLLPLPDGEFMRLAADLLPGDPLTRLAAQTSHPVALLERWAAARGIEKTRDLALHGLLEMPIVVHDGAPTAAALSMPPSDGMRPHEASGHFVWGGSVDALNEALAAHPSWIVQDVASAQAARATVELAPRRILDACAGRGTKAVQLALMHPNAEVWATDPDAARMASLRARSKGLPNLQAVDLADLGGLPSHFDLLLLDVPCSNTGMLARRLEAKYRFTVKALEELVRVQRAIAEHHLGLLAPNGRLLYSTCSLDPQENEHQVKWIAQRVGGSVISTSEWLPRGRPGGMPASRTDGSFNALIASGRRGIVSVTR